MPQVRERTNQPVEQVRIIRVDIGDLGVGVVDDVPGLFRREPVVQRHRDGTDLPGGVDDGDHRHGVRAAPDHLPAGPSAQVEQDVREPVSGRLQLGVCQLDYVVATLVVNDGELVRLSLGVDRQDVWHRTCPS